MQSVAHRTLFKPKNSRKKRKSKAAMPQKLNRSEEQRNNTLRRKERMCQQIMQLYEEERLRFDDCIWEVAEFWCYSYAYIERIWYNRPTGKGGYHQLLIKP